MSDKKTSIENAVERLTANYRKEELFLTKSGRHLPVRAAIINIVKEMRSVIFPGYFDIDSGAAVFPEHYTGYLLNDLFDRMQAQIETAFLYVGDDMTSACGKAAQITSRFFEQLPEVQEMLDTLFTRPLTCSIGEYRSFSRCSLIMCSNLTISSLTASS